MEIELDSVEVVDVTGRSHKDKKKEPKNRSCDCTSLRWMTVWILVAIVLIVLVYLVIGVVLMFDSLEDLDVQYSDTSVQRLAMMLESDLGKLRQYAMLFGRDEDAGWALRNWRRYLKNVNESYTEQSLSKYRSHLREFTTTVSVSAGSELNYAALLNNTFGIDTPEQEWYKGGNENVLVGSESSDPPRFNPETLRAVVEKDPDAEIWTYLGVPDEGDSRPILIAFLPAYVYHDEDACADYLNIEGNCNETTTQYGYVVMGRNIFPRLLKGSGIVNDVPSCITIEDGRNESEKWDDEDNKAFESTKAGTTRIGSHAFLGKSTFVKRSNSSISKTEGRLCPEVPLFDSTEELMVSYTKICGVDPELFGDDACIKFRMDRPTTFFEEGREPVILLSVLVVVLVIVICFIFVIFLDCVVLRRIESLSKVIRKQTRGHAKAREEEEESTASMRAAEEKVAGKKQDDLPKHGKSGKSSNRHKSGKSSSGTSATSATSATTDSSGTGHERGGGSGPVHDEIGTLKRAMEQNAIGLRKRLEVANDGIKIEQQKIIRHKQALQLLNIWCGRKEFFPGLRPNAMQLRYEPTRSLEDILGNTLAIEYLKTHCESDRSVENIWFILDVAWLEEIETAEDEEQDPQKRAQLHDVASSTAKTIMSRYISADAPQQINLSAGTYKKLRKIGSHYSRKMFADAVSEIKLMLDTDILPRFQKTSSYSAMSETLFIDSSGGGDSSSELSDETVSTAGSILTDEEGDEGGVGRIFAKTFNHLHTTFEVGGHDDSSSLSGDSAGRPVPSGRAKASATEAGKSSEQESPKGDDNKKNTKDDEKKENDEDSKESGQGSDSSNNSVSTSSSSS